MAQGSAERRGDGGSRAEAPGDVKTGEQRQQRQVRIPGVLTMSFVVKMNTNCDIE